MLHTHNVVEKGANLTELGGGYEELNQAKPKSQSSCSREGFPNAQAQLKDCHKGDKRQRMQSYKSGCRASVGESLFNFIATFWFLQILPT